MFNPHHHQQQQQQQQFHQHLRQLQQLFQQQTPPPPPPPPPPPQPPPSHHIPHHHGGGRPMTVPGTAPPARMVNLCSATQTIIAPNPMLQGALLMQQMQGGMRSFAMGGQQFQQFFAAGSRSSILGPVPLGVAIKTPHMGFPPRHFNPHTRYFNNDFHSRQLDRKRENEHRPAICPDSQPGASSSRDETTAVAEVSSQPSTQQLDEPTAKKQRTEGPNDLLETETSPSTEYERAAEDPDTAECILEEDGTVAEAAEALEQSRAAEQGEGPKSPLKEADQQSTSSQSEPAGSVTVTDGKDETTRSSDGAKDATGGETANKFYCYICNITCHNQQNFQSHMNGLAHQQRMMEIQHMSNACLVTLLPRVQESLQGPRKDGEKRPGLQRWCPTCKIHFTVNVMDHRKTREHKICSRSSSPSCTVCKQHFRTSREFIEHMQSTEHKQHMEEVLKETGKGNLEDLGLEVCTVGPDEEGMESDEEEKMEEENGQEGLPVQMEVTLEDITEEEEFDSDTVYGSNFVIPVAGFLCRLCNEFYHYEASARRSHCKTHQHFENLKRYKALKIQEASALQASESVCTSSDLQTKDTGSPSGSSLSDPAISNSRLESTEAAADQENTTTTTSTSKENNNSGSSSSSTPPSPNQQPASGSPAQPRDTEEDAVTEEPEDEDVPTSVPEEKTSRGRGRTPARKRGRGGRRR
ncbi:cdkn1a interacting zinc finger protein 1a isoform X2 [Silurus meridionalis]|uniref:cdkn1a interacting zinc finger protein 1a isoform X2 n=1 Tax=Silurus meridionalis TaxID=175797 RepID=UPI001EEC8536|nr:cdkn1a interacting zinc finger protein 1a isoform X2 [Silurus meridionalis]